MRTHPERSYLSKETFPPALGKWISQILDRSQSCWIVFRASDLSLCYVNAELVRFLGVTDVAALANTPVNWLILESDRTLFQQQALLHASITGYWRGTLHLVDMSGSELLTSATMGRVKNAEGGDDYYVIEAFPLQHSSQLQEDGQARAEDRDLLRELLDVVPEGIFFKDLQSRYFRHSVFLMKKFGVAESRLLMGKTDFDFYSVEHASASIQGDQQIIQSGEPVLNHEELETFPDGSQCWVSTSKFPLRNRTGQTVGVFGISRDITSIKKAEQERRELELQHNLSQKLESIGRLASGVAHEINTPAQFITDNLTFLKKATASLMEVVSMYREIGDKLKAGDTNIDIAKVKEREAKLRIDYLLREIPTSTNEMMDGLKRVTQIIRSLKEFSHPNKSLRQPANLNKAVETTVAVSRHEWKYVADLNLELCESLPLVPMMLDEVNQVILNLIVNAAHAIADANKQQGREKGLITIRSYVEEDLACLDVSDTGTGIPEAVQPHIFEPFFTTKEVGKGTGQGLAIIRSIIVKNHEGSIFFTTEPGKGTTFHIRLPIEPGKPETPAVAPATE